MTRYLLDTNIISALGDKNARTHQSCLAGLNQLQEGDELCVSILTLFELDYGIAAAPPEIAVELRRNKAEILSLYTILWLSLETSTRFGQLKAAYKTHVGAKKKTMKGHIVDMILACTALEHDAVLVSNDSLFPLLNKMAPAFRMERWSSGTSTP